MLACGPSLEPENLKAQRPFVMVTVSTAVEQGTSTELPPEDHSFALSSTFAFDSVCRFEKGFSLDVRADAAPALELSAGPWPQRGANRWSLECIGEADCDRTKAMLRWDTDAGRWDASPTKTGDGVAVATKCEAKFGADALDVGQVLVEGSCTGLLGTLQRGTEAPFFGPVTMSFKALCPRPQ